MSATASQPTNPLDPESTTPLYPHGPSPAALADPASHWHIPDPDVRAEYRTRAADPETYQRLVDRHNDRESVPITRRQGNRALAAAATYVHEQCRIKSLLRVKGRRSAAAGDSLAVQFIAQQEGSEAR